MNQTFQLAEPEVTYRENTDLSKLLQEDFENQTNKLMPEIRISFEGRKMSSNIPGEKLIQSLGISGKEKEFFSWRYPGILKSGINTDFEIHSGQYLFFFSAVAFDEAGYIGLYCYRIVKSKLYQ